MSWLLTEDEISTTWLSYTYRGYWTREQQKAFLAQAQLLKVAKRLKAGISPEDLKALYKEAGIKALPGIGE